MGRQEESEGNSRVYACSENRKEQKKKNVHFQVQILFRLKDRVNWGKDKNTGKEFERFICKIQYLKKKNLCCSLALACVGLTGDNTFKIYVL